jgi:hypothetical protein
VTTLNSTASATVSRLMREIEGEVRRQRRDRVLAHGGPEEYEDEEIFAIVESVLRRAVEQRDAGALLLPELIDLDDEWDLQLPLRFTTHRRFTGRLILFVKQRVLRPLMHWLYEYSLENFRRQQRINRLLFASIEELALENAKLRLRLDDSERAGSD